LWLNIQDIHQINELRNNRIAYILQELLDVSFHF